MGKGKLIVFEGTDGSGKRTQAELLIRALTQRTIPYTTFDFPRYKESFFGALAGELLMGAFGPIEKVPAKLAVLPFACDRWQTKDDIIHSLSQGKLVLSNRYTGSSAVYHAAKLPQVEQEGFIDWVYKLENEIIGLPKEDLVIYFHMPQEVAQSLINKRDAAGQKPKDMYEKDAQLLMTVERLYQTLITKYSHWKIIQCVKDGQVRPPEEIHKEVLDLLRQNDVF